jgi:hypothetical protein
MIAAELRSLFSVVDKLKRLIENSKKCWKHYGKLRFKDTDGSFFFVLASGIIYLVRGREKTEIGIGIKSFDLSLSLTGDGDCILYNIETFSGDRIRGYIWLKEIGGWFYDLCKTRTDEKCGRE